MRYKYVKTLVLVLGLASLVFKINFCFAQQLDSLLCPHADIRDRFDSLHKKYHHYRVGHEILDASQAKETNRAEILKLMCSDLHFVAPFPKKIQGKVSPCVINPVKIGPTKRNPVLTCIDTLQMRLINYSLPGHLLHPGKVVRSIVKREGKFLIITESWGYGKYPKLNEKNAEKVWSKIDRRFREFLEEQASESLPLK